MNTTLFTAYFNDFFEKVLFPKKALKCREQKNTPVYMSKERE